MSGLILKYAEWVRRHKAVTWSKLDEISSPSTVHANPFPSPKDTHRNGRRLVRALAS